MIILHHPLDDTMAAYAAGTLPTGPSLVLEAHLAVCAACRRRLRAFESVGGALLALEPGEPVSDDLFARALAELDLIAPATKRRAAPQRRPVDYSELAALGCAVGPWRFVQPGLKVARVTASGEPNASAMLIKVGPGRKMPRHTHIGVEYTQVLTGEFFDVSGRYGPGDYVENDEELDHQPIASADAECLCLAAIDGRLQFTSRVGRFAQSLMRL